MRCLRNTAERGMKGKNTEMQIVHECLRNNPLARVRGEGIPYSLVEFESRRKYLRHQNSVESALSLQRCEDEISFTSSPSKQSGGIHS